MTVIFRQFLLCSTMFSLHFFLLLFLTIFLVLYSAVHMRTCIFVLIFMCANHCITRSYFTYTEQLSLVEAMARGMGWQTRLCVSWYYSLWNPGPTLVSMVFSVYIPFSGRCQETARKHLLNKTGRHYKTGRELDGWVFIFRRSQLKDSFKLLEIILFGKL